MLMEKTSVYLSSADRRRLAWIAEREGISQAQAIRLAIDSYNPASADRNFAGARSGAGPGDSIADHAEDELLEHFG